MAEIKERALKVLQALSQMTEPARPSQIGEIIGEKPIDVGRFLAELLKAGLVEKTDEEQNLWTVTEKGPAATHGDSSPRLDRIELEPLLPNKQERLQCLIIAIGFSSPSYGAR